MCVVDSCTVPYLGPCIINRKQLCLVNSIESDKVNINIGCPQGSILGPFFFGLYINDIHLQVKNCSILCYADDTTLWHSKDDVSKIYLKLQRDLTDLIEYFEYNGLTINLSKTEYIIFKLRRNQNNKGELIINGTALRQVTSTKYLGIIIDEQLNWKEHCEMLLSRVMSGKHLLSCGIFF